MSKVQQFETRLAQAVRQVDPTSQPGMAAKAGLLLLAGVNDFGKLLSAAVDEELDTELRVIACWFLSRLGDNDAALSPLLKCLRDRDPVLKSEAARALGTIGSAKAALPLISAVQSDASDEVRFYSIYALGLIGDDIAVEPLVAVLMDLSQVARVRGMAAETLSRFRGDRVVSTLTSCLSDSLAEVRYWAAYALGELGASQALSELSRLANTDHEMTLEGESVSDEAAEAVRKIRASEAD